MPTVTLQPGPDAVQWESWGGLYILENFETGPGGDRLTNWEQFFNWFPGSPNRWWFEEDVLDDPAAVAANPFESGRLRLIDSAEGALFQYRSSTTADWQTMVIFKGVQASQLTEYNLGWSPAGGRPAGGEVTYGENRDEITDTAGDDIIHTLGGNDFVRLGHGNDTVYLGDGSDSLQGAGTGYKIVHGGAGDDDISIIGPTVAPGRSATVSELYGEEGNDRLVGGGNDDLLDGGVGSDTLDARAGNDDLFGGAGDDTMVGGNGSDLLIGGQGADTVFGGIYTGGADNADDVDTVSYADALSGVTVDLRPTVEVYGFFGDIYLGGTASDGLGGSDLLVSVEGVIGSAFADTIQGHGRNVIESGDGDDRIVEGVEDHSRPNLLIIEAQSELFNGVAARFALEIDGEVIATVQFDPTPSNPGGGLTAVQRFEFEIDGRVPLESLRLVHLNAEGGQRDIYTYYMGIELPDRQGDIYLANNVTYTADGGTPRFHLGQMSNGGVLDFDVSVYNDVIGNDFTDNDHYDGGAGLDTVVYSGASTDYEWTQEADGSWTIVDLRPDSPEGTDRLIGVERLEFSDGLFDMAGDPVSPEINGTAGGDNLSGTADNDVINGLGGDDVLNGLAGDDVLTGGDGNDILTGGPGSDTLNGGDGVDTARYAGMATGVEVYLDLGVSWDGTSTDFLISIENVTGSDHSDYIVGSTGANVLIGGAGDDFLLGMAGDDLLIGGAGVDRLDGGEGDDAINYGASAAGVEVYLNNGISWDGTSMDFLTSIEHVSGSNHDDYIVGTAGDNILIGNAGNDFLFGMAGDDLLSGGVGVDRLDGGEGTDTIIYAASATGVEIYLDNGVSWDGVSMDFLTSIENVTGSGHDDYMVGTTGANELIGGDGNDFLFGMAGDDLLIGGSGVDRLIGGEGVDTITYEDSAAGVEIYLDNGISWDGTSMDFLDSIENVSGSDNNDYMVGTSGANTLIGGDGDDILYGMAGDDLLGGGAGVDRMYGGDGDDTISYASSTAGVEIYLDNGISWDGTSMDTLDSIENVIGSDHADYMMGSAGANVLTGGAGNDTLNGGDGTDTAVYSGNRAAYTISLSGGVTSIAGPDGTDTLTNIERLQFADGLYDIAGNPLAAAAEDLPQVMPAVADDKSASGPEVMPTVSDDFVLTGKFDIDMPVMPTLPGDFGPLIMPAVVDPVLSLVLEGPRHIYDQRLNLLDEWSGLQPPSRGDAWE